VIRDGFLIDGSAPPPELKYSYGGGKMNRSRVRSVPAHLIRIHGVGKPNDQANDDEPYLRDGSPPPSPKHAVLTGEAYWLKWNDGFRTMRMLPLMTMSGGKPVKKMSWCVKKIDGSHQ